MDALAPLNLVIRKRLEILNPAAVRQINVGGRNWIDIAASSFHPWWATRRRLGYPEYSLTMLECLAKACGVALKLHVEKTTFRDREIGWYKRKA